MTDSALADHAESERPTRRALLGAGALGAVVALAASRPAAAGTSGLSDNDLDISTFAIALELTARDLYDEAIAAGADGDIWTTMRAQHQSYAERLAGITGVSATTRDDATFDQLSEAFADSNPAAAAFELENVAAATHTELLGQVDDPGIASAMASFVSMESRHATTLAATSGQDDLDALFLNSATGLSPEA